MSNQTDRQDIGECRVESDDILNHLDKENNAPISLRATNGRQHPSILYPKSQNKQSALILNLPALRGALKSAQSNQQNYEDPFEGKYQPLLQTTAKSVTRQVCLGKVYRRSCTIH